MDDKRCIPFVDALPPWSGCDSEISTFVRRAMDGTICAYQAQPALIEEHLAIESNTLATGYEHRQIFELVQNAADAIALADARGRVEVVLTATALYCANEGAPIDTDGAQALLMSHMSRKGGLLIGRFGLGFKSVLAVSLQPQFYSRTGSFGFGSASLLQQIREHLQEVQVQRLPILRMAEPLDPTVAATEDPILESLMGWATTVVKLPIDSHPTWLANDLQGFPAEFLLFSPQVRELVLDDRIAQTSRRITVTQLPEEIRVEESGGFSRWRVFTRKVELAELSDAELQDACDFRRHCSAPIPIVWAVPLAGNMEPGRFWAFFPTNVEAPVAGVLNAHWKTNSDRQELLDGPFNRAILKKAASLVADSLPLLANEDDPGRLLDVLPARWHWAETTWTGKILSGALHTQLSATHWVPAVTGKFQLPSEISRRPFPSAKGDDVVKWLRDRVDIASEPSAWCHRSVEQSARRERAHFLGVKEGTLAAWLQAVAGSQPEQSALAVELVDLLWDGLSESQQNHARKTTIVMTEEGTAAAPDKTHLFLPHQNHCPVGSAQLVHPHLAESEPIREILQRRFSLDRISATAELEPFIAQIKAGQDESLDWGRFWEQTRRAPLWERERKLSRFRHHLQVMTRGGTFRQVGKVLLPGPIVPDGGIRDREVTVDVEYHHDDLALLQALKVVVDRPHPDCDARVVQPSPAWLLRYRAEMRIAYRRSLPSGSSNPQDDYLSFLNSVTHGPLDPLIRLSAEGSACFTDALLPFVVNESPWVMGHDTRQATYPLWEAEPRPLAWLIRTYGCFHTSLAPRPLDECVGPQLDYWRTLLPVARCTPEQANHFGLPSTLDDLTEALWAQALDRAANSNDDGLVGRLYAEAARRCPAPPLIRCCQGTQRLLVDPKQVAVAVGEAAADLLRGLAIPTLLVPDADSAQTLESHWHCKSGTSAPKFVPSEMDNLLLDRYPGLKGILEARHAGLRLQACTELWFDVPQGGDPGGTRREVEFARDGDVFYHVHTLDDGDLLQRLSKSLHARLDESGLKRVIEYLSREDRSEHVQRIRACTRDAGRLLEAVGADAIRRRLPEELFMAHEALPPERLAEVALAVHGIDVLRLHEEDLQHLDPPRQWSGGGRAMEFVEELGFSREYAGFRPEPRDPWLEVDGPPGLPGLHEHQETIAKRICEFFEMQSPGRGLVCLPTGAGKTRVVVEALVRSSTRWTDRPIVWIAQVDELCEQAVQTWHRVWRAVGPARRLRISRLWGSTNTRVRPIATESHVVVCTDRSLANRCYESGFAWLHDASCVVIDEAHHAIAPTYTDLLRWFGLTDRNTDRPLIGVTATPHRGFNEEDTKRLASRFGRNRLDEGVLPGDPYAELQKRGILAQVESETLDGSVVELDADERRHLEQFEVLPAPAEERLGRDPERNRRLLESIAGLPEDWPVLLFAASVHHARPVAAMLCARGIVARAISGDTRMSARRHYIEEFQAGRIRVLTNYNVLSTGFDAPAVRALYVARPVFSPVLYQQMIGRGLRGPQNGGKERCLIVNVEDNVLLYGTKLAFHNFEGPWKKRRVASPCAHKSE